MADDLESRISRIESKLVVMLEKYRRLEAEKEEYQREQKLFGLFGLLLPFGQWAYGESRVQKQ